MRVLVANRSDSASCNIRDRLLASGQWRPAGTFRGHPVHVRGAHQLVEVDGPVVQDEALAGDLSAERWPITAVWFLSRHRAESGQPSFTVHPIGNHQEARYGGLPQTLSPAAPLDMALLLRALRRQRDAWAVPHEVTYEATHHGPLMRMPSLFLEIGSDEAWYEDQRGGNVVAASVHDALDALEASAQDPAPIVVGVGGGHYVPQHTDKALAGEYAFGHLLPAYAIDPDAADGQERLRRCIEATPGCQGVYVHRKGLKGPQRQAVRMWCEALGAPML